MDDISKTPPVSSSDGKDKNKENTERDRNLSQSKILISYSGFYFLGVFLIVILMFFLFVKRKK